MRVIRYLNYYITLNSQISLWLRPKVLIYFVFYSSFESSDFERNYHSDMNFGRKLVFGVFQINLDYLVSNNCPSNKEFGHCSHTAWTNFIRSYFFIRNHLELSDMHIFYKKFEKKIFVRSTNGTWYYGNLWLKSPDGELEGCFGYCWI